MKATLLEQHTHEKHKGKDYGIHDRGRYDIKSKQDKLHRKVSNFTPPQSLFLSTMLYTSNPKMTAADESSSDDVRDDLLLLLLFGDLTTSEASSMDLTTSNDDSILGGTIFDSLNLKRNEAMRRHIIKDEEEEEEDDDVMDDKNDTEAPQDQAISTPSSCHRRQRRGVRRGHQDSFDSTSFSSATTFTVMTKTHDGSSSSSSSISSDLSTSLYSTLSKSSTTARAA